jgi:hypothetical protein
VIPCVRSVKQVKTDRGSSFLLQVTNPTLSSVRFRFAPSTYAGEPDWDDGKPSIFLSNLLVDSFTQALVSADLRLDLLNNMEPTAFVELLSSEDSIIELGGKTTDTPKEVLAWKPTSDDNYSTVGIVATSSSSAWFEVNLVIANADQQPAAKEGVAMAVPLALQIEIGNESWESSLIQPRMMEEDETDRVSFDLVVIVQSNEE